MWKSGATTKVTSSSTMSIWCMAFVLFHQRLAWVSMAPLGRPVVPEVYMISATSSGSSGSARPSGALLRLARLPAVGRLVGQVPTDRERHRGSSR